MLYHQPYGKWIVTPAPSSGAKMRLFCFPFAGGSASFYHEWQKYLSADIEVSAIELPGRGSRFGEALRYRMDEIVEPLAEALEPLCDSPFIIFGHSLGSLMGYAITLKLKNMGKQPLALLASGRSAPCVPLPEMPLHTLDDKMLIQRLGEYNGTSSEVLDDPDMRALFLPIIRADLEVNDTYLNDCLKLACPIHSFAGLSDSEAPPHLVERWGEMTEGEFSISRFKGGHFFLKEEQGDFMAALNKRLESIFRHAQAPEYL